CARVSYSNPFAYW
nr:immunoglobulin heavy chain junction region [Mus musculus]NSM09544.1 immunoglobulin heavy chain junction region [Mus musculus]